MELFDKMQAYLNSLDQRRFYQYLAGILGAILLCLFLLLFYYYHSISSLKAEADEINDLRQDGQILLNRAQRIKKDQKEIDAVLAQDKNFKIRGYFQDLINKLGLAQKKSKDSEFDVTPGSAQEGTYQESILDAQFTSMSMKELTELLQEIELNKRVFIKALDISDSKQANSIDVTLVIATLEPKQRETSESTE